MANSTSLSFASLAETESALVQASATAVGGLLVRQDFMPIIGDYRPKYTKLWQALKNNRMPASSPKVQEIRRTIWPQVAFVGRGALGTAPNSPPGTLTPDISDPGQDVKVISGMVEVDHFALSMVTQQGNVYGTQLNKDTDDIIISMLRFLERKLFTGDASLAGNLEFNGLIQQMSTATQHVYTASIVSSPPDKINDRLDEVCMRAAIDSENVRQPTHIFCSGAGARLLVKEIKELQLYYNVHEISPGVQVPSILTSFGYVDIITSPYIADVSNPGGNDIINYYIVDINSIEWHGVYPYGGDRTFDPQIFDLAYVINGLPTLAKRLILIYGTPYCKNRGEGIYQLQVTAPPGSTFQNNG